MRSSKTVNVGGTGTKPSTNGQAEPEAVDQVKSETASPYEVAAEQAAEQALPSEDTPATPPFDVELADHSQEELKLLDAIYAAVVKTVNLQREERQLASQLEELRDELNSAREFKASLIGQLPDALLKLRDGIEFQIDEVAGTDDDPVGDSEESSLGWKSIETKTICDNIPRLGEKKVADLCDDFSTLGKLDDAYCVSVSRKIHFSAVLPTGIGKGIADELANRLLDAKTNHDTPPACEQVKENQVASEPEAEPEPEIQVAADGYVDVEDEEVEPETEAPVAPKSTKNSLQTEQAFADQPAANWMEDFAEKAKANGDLKAKMSKEAFNNGFQSGLDELPIDACPQVMTVYEKQDWLRGWVTGVNWGSEL